VPIERADEYLHRLIALGHRVAVCEQLEDPAEARKRGAKSVVHRDVVRLVTPGTLTEDTLLDARSNNYLLALARARTTSEEDRFALAWIDISTGEFHVGECDRATLAAEIARIEPGETIVSDAFYSDPEWMPYLRSLPTVTPLTRDIFDGATAERRLAAFFGVATTASFGTFSRVELTAAAAAVTYVERTQLGKRPPLSPPMREAAGATLAIDQATRGNLELVRTLTGERRGSLLAAVDCTVTVAGSRLLAQRLAAPLTDPGEIGHRLDAVAVFVNDAAARTDLRERLKAAPDLARALSRIVIGRGGPRDLAAVGDGISAAAQIAERISALADIPRDVAQAVAALRRPDTALAVKLKHALADELPAFRRDGGFVRTGYEAALDEARALRDESRRVVAALQVRYAETTGVRSLKVRHNNVLGYFVDVTAQHGEKLLSAPLNATFIHRQTLAGQVRFTTTELGELEAKIANAAERALALELEIFDRLCVAVTAASTAIKAAAEALAAVDVAAALASLAAARDYVRPQVDDSLAFVVAGGRHPVVEQALADGGGPFVANDCDLSPLSSYPPAPAGENAKTAGRIWLITGPNMAGKSTFLRQNALIAVLAQMGSFVPARAAHIGVVDRLFSRVGAADDLARGRSTFMVEMVETAAILNQAGERALVILDEIGRGTATFDGLSIAWATIEHLHENNRCRALFATHFHEMTALSAKLARLHNATMRVKEWQGEVVFLHEVVPGAADRSYGIQVAKLAGLPPSVIERAKLVLAQLEAEDRISPARKLIDDLPLFAATQRGAPPTPQADASLTALVEALAALNPDEMSPRDALEALYALKGQLTKPK
jgi:DNA mismatch repair protein MutS